MTMVMPPHFTREPSPEEPLTENVFVLHGYTLDILEFRVLDDGTGKACQVEVRVDTERVVAPQWKDADELPPGAVQWRGVARIAFFPAVPGRVYRLESEAGTVRCRYQGPEVPASG